MEALLTNPRPCLRTRAVATVDVTLEPQYVQTVVIHAAGAGQAMNAQDFAVDSGEMRLEFIDLFLRQPRANEHDLVIGEHYLRQTASLDLSQ